MRSFYVDHISANRGRTPEGYLVVRNCNISRSGYQIYRADEIGAPGTDLIRVYRSPKEVFAPAAMESAEGKSITELHPNEPVTAHTDMGVNCGHAQNVRVGPMLEDGNQALIADLVIKNASLISKIEGELMREISVGYTCGYSQDESGQWLQQNILVNHIAIVPSGRAGELVRVHDHSIELQDLAVAVTDSNTIRTQPEIRVETPATQPKEKPRAMASSATAKSNPITRFFVQAFSARMKDGADPEELEKAAADYAALATERAEKQAGDSAEEEAEKKKQEDRKAKDAAEEEGKKLKEKEEADKKAKDAAAAEEKAAADKKVKDEFEAKEKAEKESADKAARDKAVKDAEGDGTELHPKLKEMSDHVSHMRDCMDSMMDHFGVEKKSAESKDEGLIPMVTEGEADRPKNPIPGADSNGAIKEYLIATKKEAAQSRDNAVRQRWNDAWTAANGGAGTGTNGHSAILHAGMPEHTKRATQFTGDSVIDNEKRMDENVKRAAEAFDAARKKLQGVN